MEQTSVARQLALWSSGLRSEVQFWERWFATKGDQWPEDFEARLDPNREIEPWIMGGIAGTKVLDVGAGPMTKLGMCYHGKRLELTACDPLAFAYAEIAANFGVRRPIPTQIGFAEDLSAFFPSDAFDVVHCGNALDHSFDPIRGIEEMLMVVRVGGRVVLSHSRNEAEFEKYEGLHQWNFDTDSSGAFIVWNKSERTNASERFANCADTQVHISEGRGMAVIMQKRTAPPACDVDRYRQRIRELLMALVPQSAAAVRNEGAAW